MHGRYTTYLLPPTRLPVHVHTALSDNVEVSLYYACMHACIKLHRTALTALRSAAQRLTREGKYYSELNEGRGSRMGLFVVYILIVVEGAVGEEKGGREGGCR